MPAGTESAAVVGAVAGEPRLADARFAAPEAPAATDFWSLLVSARTSDQLCRAWLGILCQWVPGTQAGLLLLHESAERYAPAAVWPDPERDMSFLRDIAQEALVERRGVVHAETNGLAQCAYPLLGADQAYGVVVLHVVARGEAGMRESLRLLHWGAGWLVGLYDKRSLLERDTRLRRSALLQDLVLGTLAERTPHDAARWVVNRLAEALPCRSAMLGRATGGAIELVSISGSASFDARSTLLSLAREAMREALVSGTPQIYPNTDAGASTGPAPLEASSIFDYCSEAGAGAALALPLIHQGRHLGALLIEFADKIDAETRAFAETVALALAACLEIQQDARQDLLTHTRAAVRGWRESIFGPRYPGLKLAAIVGVAIALAGALVDADYRLRASAVVEGQVQRAAVAPFDGYLREAPMRAGDVVHRGDVLARLDDRDLRLEDAKRSAECELAERKVREAMSKDSAVAVRLAQAEADQARAELALVREKLARVAVVAPFDGIVVKGDLSQQLGAPVEQGKILFEVAPLDAYRVLLKVDERDVLDVRPGSEGELLLSGLPGVRLPLRVTRVAPVAAAEDGRNSFRVEAAVLSASVQVQPGMEGVGKIKAGEHSLLWIWTHHFVGWLRFTLWSLGL